MDKADLQLKRGIEDELRLDPKVNAALIGVNVSSGTVTLAGVVDTYAQKWTAEVATKRVAGVRIVAQGITVRDLGNLKPDRSTIGAAVAGVLRWNAEVARTAATTGQNGAVTLEGQTTWSSQFEAAERAARLHAGVVALYNSFFLRPRGSAAQMREKVLASLLRQKVDEVLPIPSSG